MKDYLAYWGFAEPPFTRFTPAGELFAPHWLPPLVQRLEVFASRGPSLSIVTAPPGCGKSTLARCLYEGLDQAVHESLLLALVNEERQTGWLLPRLSAFFGAQTTGNSLETTAAGLDRLAKEGRRLFVIIDGAERLADVAAFDEMAALLDLQALGGSVLGFLLLATPRLEDVLRRSQAIEAKVSCRSSLPLLKRDETAAYLAHRLRLAGLSANVFEDQAVDVIHAVSAGAFARINAVAENALLEAFLRKTRTVDLAAAREASRYVAAPGPEFDERESTTPAPPPAAPPESPRPLTRPDSGLRKSEEAAISAISLSSLFKGK